MGVFHSAELGYINKHFLSLFFSEANMERDKYLTPYDAKDFGLIDIVLEHPPTIEEEIKVISSSSS